MMEYGGQVIHIDPVSRYANYSALPKANIILITHQHGDHFDQNAISKISRSGTVLICNPEVQKMNGSGTALKNGETTTQKGITIKAVPACNTTPGREGFHPKGRDNGYVLEFKNLRVYVAGNTEDIPEMAELSDIDIAFLPMNQPYTMTPGQVAKAVRRFE
ncbi:MAG: hypothetical protein DRP87_07120 [Spirochaetes bacterium]|nr:MAG: hypothetical protein DRP87_07120 [Spirochaetota bacterium]